MRWIPTTGWHVITPEIAAEVLATCNYGNRRMNQFAIDSFARDMESGNWVENGDSIKFAKNFRLLDGQTRLAAIIKHGRPIKTYVVTDLDEKVFFSIDCHRARKAGVILELDGVKNANTVASVARFLIGYEHGFYGTAWTRQTISERRSVIERYRPDLIQRGVREAVRLKMRHVSSLATLYVLGSKADERMDSDTTERFFAQLAGDSVSGAGDPAFTLKTKLTNATIDRRTLPPPEEMANCIKAWNAEHNRSELKVIRWRPSSNKDEPFPHIIGWPYATPFSSRRE